VFKRLRDFEKPVAAIAAAVLALAAVPASAQSISQTVYAVGDGTPNQIELPKIFVTASIGGVCGFGSAPSGSYDAQTIDTTAWTNDFLFKLNCTVPSRVAVVSTNGGLRTPAAPGAAGYTNLAPYLVTLFLKGTATTATASCEAGTLAAAAGAPCTFRGPSAAGQGLRLNDTSINLDGSYLRVSADAYNNLPASNSAALINGAYSDTLTITVSASP